MLESISPPDGQPGWTSSESEQIRSIGEQISALKPKLQGKTGPLVLYRNVTQGNLKKAARSAFTEKSSGKKISQRVASLMQHFDLQVTLEFEEPILRKYVQQLPDNARKRWHTLLHAHLDQQEGTLDLLAAHTAHVTEDELPQWSDRLLSHQQPLAIALITLPWCVAQSGSERALRTDTPAINYIKEAIKYRFSATYLNEAIQSLTLKPQKKKRRRLRPFGLKKASSEDKKLAAIPATKPHELKRVRSAPNVSTVLKPQIQQPRFEAAIAAFTKITMPPELNQFFSSCVRVLEEECQQSRREQVRVVANVLFFRIIIPGVIQASLKAEVPLTEAVSWGDTLNQLTLVSDRNHDIPLSGQLCATYSTWTQLHPAFSLC